MFRAKFEIEVSSCEGIPLEKVQAMLDVLDAAKHGLMKLGYFDRVSDFYVRPVEEENKK